MNRQQKQRASFSAIPPTLFRTLLLILVLGDCASAQTPTVPVGDDFLVNSYTSFAQYGSAAAMNESGDFVVVWTSTSGTVDSDYGAFGQLYASDGQTVGGEFLVNTFTSYNQYAGGVVMNQDGSFIVTWDGYEESSFAEVVFTQRYAADGTPVGGETLVSDVTRSSFGSLIAADATGDFIIVWNALGEGDDGFGVRAAAFASDGTPMGDSFAVNTYTTEDQEDPSITRIANGEYLVTWSSGPFLDSDLYGRRFASGGDALGAEFLINTYTSGRQSSSAVAMADTGEFIVVWASNESDNGDSQNTSIQGQRFGSGGVALGAQFLVNSYTTGTQSSPDIAIDPSGDFLVVWSSTSDPGDTSQSSVQGQRYASDGRWIGEQFRVNEYTTGTQVNPSVVVDGIGDFLVVWDSSSSGNGDPASFSVQARRFRATADIGDFVFDDLNRNGIQEAGEPGLAGVAVHLYSEGGDLLDSAQTDEQGNFLFQPKIALTGLADRYFLEVEAPEGSVFTVQDAGLDDEIDSDVDSLGRTATFEVLSAGETRLEFDAGLYPTQIFADGFESGDTSAWGTN